MFVTSDGNDDHETVNQQVFADFVAEVEDGGDLILDKITARVAHGGGIQVAEDSDDYGHFERFLDLLAPEEPAREGFMPDEKLRLAVAEALGLEPDAEIAAEDLAELEELTAAGGRASRICPGWKPPPPCRHSMLESTISWISRPLRVSPFWRPSGLTAMRLSTSRIWLA